MATITVYSTKGQRMVKIQSEANTWGELKKDLAANGIQHEGMQAVVNETKGILKLDGAVLPKGLTAGDKVTDNFTLFLSPSKQSAGTNSESMSYAELRAYIKAKRAKSQEAKNFFGDYTHDTKEELRDLVKSWVDSHKKEKAEFKVSESKPYESIDTNGKLVKVFNLLKESLDVLSTIPGVSDSAEFEKLKEEATAVEFELNHN